MSGGFGRTIERVARLAGVLALAACVTRDPERAPLKDRVRVDPGPLGRIVPSDPQPFSPGPAGPPSARGEDQKLLELSASPFHRFERNVIRSADGMVTKFYYFRPERGAAFKELLQAHVSGFAALPDDKKDLRQKFVVDPRTPNPTSYAIGQGVPTGVGGVADVLIVTATADVIAEVDRFLERLIEDIPQVEIIARVVEINLSDKREWGVDASLVLGSELNPARTLLKGGSLSLPTDTTQELLLTFSSIQDERTLSLLLDFIQNTTDSDILSAPKMVVLNGHRGVIDTGQQTPFLKPSYGLGGDISGGEVQFKDTGIKLIVTPFVLHDDYIQLDVSAEVSAVTGFITVAEVAGTPLQNPEISRRNAFTVINVRSGQTVIIGGLIATNEIESVTKVPLLGDIPILGYLFKRQIKSQGKSQVIFMVTPRLLDKEEEVLDPSIGE